MPSCIILIVIILILSYPIVNAHLFVLVWCVVFFFFLLTFAPEFEKQTHTGMLISVLITDVLFAQSNLYVNSNCLEIYSYW